MIDLHCHILPRLDDGALDMDDSVAMAREGASDGIEMMLRVTRTEAAATLRTSSVDK